MNYETFVNKFLEDLRNDNDVLYLIEQNKELIQENLEDNHDVNIMKKFINDIIDVIVCKPKKKYNVIKKALKHKNMATVYHYFKNSPAMIRAVEANNKEALDWLISMKVDPTVQDENGMTVLMHIIQNKELSSYVKTFASDKFCINQEDNYGRTALFYALDNTIALWKLMEYGIDINHKDHEGCNVLIYCCKNKKLQHLKYLLKQKIDVNAIDDEGRTAGMYLAMNGFYTDAYVKGKFSLYHSIMSKSYSTFLNLQNAGYDINYISVVKESALSLFLKHMYESSDPKNFDNYVRTLISLIFTGCDFNTPIDKDENLAMMIFLLANDYESFNFVSRHCKDIDYSKKNVCGENISSLYMKTKNEKFLCTILNSPTFDIDYTDPTNGNNILMLAVITRPYLITDLLNKKPELLHEINFKGETSLMVACKANNYKSVETLLNQDHINVNNQDKNGNTALHYAIQCRNPQMIQKLIECGANVQLKNSNDQSPYDLAMEFGDKTLLKVLNNDMTSEEILQLMENNDQSKILKDIDEYLYHLITIIEYRCINLTEEMIETEANTYNTIEMEKREFGQDLRGTNNRKGKKSGLLDEIMKIIY